jgi:hypothetical protein
VASLTRQLRVLSTYVLLAVLSTSITHADSQVVASKTPVVAQTAKPDFRHPVALLGHVIASLVGTDVVQDGNVRMAAALASRSPLFPQARNLTIRFAPDPEHHRVSLLLADSQVRVRLTHDVLLRCEVSSRDESNADAELKLDLGVQFKFK